jgi:ABC-type transport system substrate-binding protein
VAHGIDREAIAKAVVPYLPNARPAFNFQHPALRGYDPSMPGLSYDPGKAKALFAQCGFAGAFRILVGPSTAGFIEVYNDAVADSLRRTVGVQVEWNRVANFYVLVQAARAGNAPIWMFAWGAAPSDPGYPSIAMGLVSELISDPEVRALAQRGDARAVEEAILGKALVIPTIYY